MNSPIILLGSGRSGSTLIQRIINTSPNIVMWGEHNGFLKGIANSYFNLQYSQQMDINYYSQTDVLKKDLIIGSFRNNNTSINWLNSFEKNINRIEYQKFIHSLFNQNIDISDKKWGFKEILYTQHDHVVDFMIELFPRTKFIYSIRNPFDVILSMMLAFYPKDAINQAFSENNKDSLIPIIHEFTDRWATTALSIKQWMESAKFKCTLIKFEDLISNPNLISAILFSFLEEPNPKNSIDPLSKKLERTDKSKYRDELKTLIESEIECIETKIGELARYFNYELKFN